MTLIQNNRQCKCKCSVIYANEEDYLTLDFSGTLYYVHKSTLLKVPNGFLESLWMEKDKKNFHLPRNVFKSNLPNRYFLNRSHVLFDFILNYYITGKLHFPQDLCEQTIDEELKFWKIDQNFACKFCSADFYSTIDDDDEKEEIKNIDETAGVWFNFKKKMWTFFSKPRSSTGATIYAVIASLFVIISITNLVVASIPELHLCPEDGNTEIYSASELDKVYLAMEIDLVHFNNSANRTHSTNNTVSFKPDGVLRFFSNCLGMQKFEIVEMICICWFTVELIARFTVCPRKCEFVQSASNVIDFLASFPYYIEIFMWLFGIKPNALFYTFTLGFRSLRSITVLRVLKLGRYSRDLTVLAHTIREARSELGTLVLVLFVEILTYACIVYNLEYETNKQFHSILDSIWWSVATVSTVGYGDIYPKTAAGRIVGSIACVTGIALVALPISTLVDKFTKIHKRAKLKN